MFSIQQPNVPNENHESKQNFNCEREEHSWPLLLYKHIVIKSAIAVYFTVHNPLLFEIKALIVLSCSILKPDSGKVSIGRTR